MTAEPFRATNPRLPGGGGIAVTQHQQTESNHPPAAPCGLTRRRALRLAVMASAGALAAACGEPEIPKIQPPVLPSTQRTQAAATQRTESAATPLPTVAVDLSERVPRPGTPPPPPPPSSSQTTPARPSDVPTAGTRFVGQTPIFWVSNVLPHSAASVLLPLGNIARRTSRSCHRPTRWAASHAPSSQRNSSARTTTDGLHGPFSRNPLMVNTRGRPKSFHLSHRIR